MAQLSDRLQAWGRGVLVPADGFMNRLYGWRFNPLYHSGALTLALFVVVLVTGVYLLFFYRLSAPYESVHRLTQQVWVGSWVRSLHRYASDAAVVTATIHAFRMFVQHRSWGPRTLAWVSGLVLLFVLFVCGWTGYVMVWDAQGLVLAREGARFLDALPLFSEPISRAFVGERPLPDAFFFLNLFLHVALPVGMGTLLWLHVSRVARPGLLPPRGLLWGTVVLLLALSVAWPASLGPAADLFHAVERAPYDAFYSFWLPLTQPLPSWVVWTLGGGAAVAVVLVPLWARPHSRPRLEPSVVNARLCTGCRQCYLDCPYEAISMVPRPGGRSEFVAQVDPALCVSCGICAGSCAPMGVGPPRRTGRDQLAAAKAFVADRRPGPLDVVLVACSRGAGGVTAQSSFDGSPVYAVDCVGSAHTSVIEYLVRCGVGGVLIVACPPRDCWNREGPTWLEQRLYHDREAELKERVDRRRVRLHWAGGAEPALVLAELRKFRRALGAVEPAIEERDIDLDLTCDPADEEEVVA